MAPRRPSVVRRTWRATGRDAMAAGRSGAPTASAHRVIVASSLVEPAIGASAGRLETRLDDLFVGFGIWSLAFAPIVAVLGRTPTATPAAAPTGPA